MTQITSKAPNKPQKDPPDPTKEGIFLSYCSVAPLHHTAQQVLHEFHTQHGAHGLPSVLPYLMRGRDAFSQAFSKLLRTTPESISAIHSTAAGCSMLAMDYPLNQGDHLLVYEHEYPSNYFPWYLAAKRSGATLETIKDIGGNPSAPHSFSIDAIRKQIRKSTRMICLSHVQFSNGFCVDLEAIATLCREHDIDLILDATQSIGALPVYPEELEIAAVLSSGWKWLMGPHGIGMMYTSTSLREKLNFSHGGPAMMQQGYADLLDLEWKPHSDGRRFEYSTLPGAYLLGLATVVEQVFLNEGIEQITELIQQHHLLFKDRLAESTVEFIDFAPGHTSSILGFTIPSVSPESCCAALQARGVFLTCRGGYVRFAPHFCTTKSEVEETISYLQELL